MMFMLCLESPLFDAVERLTYSRISDTAPG